MKKKPHELAKPLLKKSAIVSTLALTGWLTGLGAIFYGINRAFDHSAKKKGEKNSKSSADMVMAPAPPMMLMKSSNRFATQFRAPLSMNFGSGF